MIKNNKPIKKIQLKNLSDAKNLLTKTAGAVFAIGAPRLKPVSNVITGAKNLVTGSINAYKAGRRVEQFKRSGQHSFTNLSQKEKLMKQSSPMNKFEYDLKFKTPSGLSHGNSKAAKDVIDRGKEIIGKKVFRDTKSKYHTIGDVKDTPSMNMTQMEQHMKKMNIGDLKKAGEFETGILKGRKPKIKG